MMVHIWKVKSLGTPAGQSCGSNARLLPSYYPVISRFGRQSLIWWCFDMCTYMWRHFEFGPWTVKPKWLVVFLNTINFSIQMSWTPKPPLTKRSNNCSHITDLQQPPSYIIVETRFFDTESYTTLQWNLKFCGCASIKENKCNISWNA